MTSTFDRVFDLLIGHEGGYVNDPLDPGGETKFGISKRSYPNLDIRSLTVADAKGIYYRDYWQACRCGEMPVLVAVLVFDAAVNNGRGSAIRFLQRALKVADDGVLGPVTMGALKTADSFAIAEGIQRERIDLMRKFSTWSRFGGGWAARLATLPVQAAAIQFART